MDKKEKLVKIRLPLSRTEKEPVFVAVNGRNFLIARGQEVELPWNFVKVLERQEKVLEAALRYEEEAARPLEAMEKKAAV